MKCPVCTTVELKMTDRQGVAIDYCPECRGVWLDRGELDKIIERSSSQAAAPALPPPEPQYQQSGHHQQPYRKQHHDDHGSGQNGHYRKKSWLSELFD